MKWSGPGGGHGERLAVWAGIVPFVPMSRSQSYSRMSRLTGSIHGFCRPLFRLKLQRLCLSHDSPLDEWALFSCYCMLGPGSGKVLVAANLYRVVGIRGKTGFLCVAENKERA